MRLRVLASILALTFSGIVSATPIKFEYTGTGSGSLGGTGFADAAFNVTAYADTDDRQSFSDGYFINHLSTVIDISGLGSFTFVTATRTFINNSAGVLGLSRANLDGLDLYNGPFGGIGTTWDMLSSLGPVPGTFGLLQWNYPVDTSGGVLAFRDGQVAGTFTATLVPEPMTSGLLAAGLLAVVWMRRRRLTAAD